MPVSGEGDEFDEYDGLTVDVAVPFVSSSIAVVMASVALSCSRPDFLRFLSAIRCSGLWGVGKRGKIANWWRSRFDGTLTLMRDVTDSNNRIWRNTVGNQLVAQERLPLYQRIPPQPKRVMWTERSLASAASSIHGIVTNIGIY